MVKFLLIFGFGLKLDLKKNLVGGNWAGPPVCGASGGVYPVIYPRACKKGIKKTGPKACFFIISN